MLFLKDSTSTLTALFLVSWRAYKAYQTHTAVLVATC